VVSLYEKYVALCPDLPDEGPFYLQPLKKPKDKRWFSSVAVGRNTLYRTVGRICSQAGFEGIVLFFVWFFLLLYVYTQYKNIIHIVIIIT
jgi:hypothetical protein